MYESSPRSREVANALFQVDKLTEDQVRAVLRHLTIDDAVLNEAQCSHIACVINGTLHKLPREGVNASLTCSTNLDAASHWEKHFASHPGHVSATFRSNAIAGGAQVDESMKQVTLLKSEERAEETAPAAINDMLTDTKPSVGGLPEAKGLTIINQGQMTLHYHSYHEASSLAQQSATVPRKRALERSEDEEYSEALASLMDFNLSATNNPTSLVTPKRLRLEGPEPQEHQEKLKEAEDQPGQIQISKKHKLCKNCGKFFYPSQNNGSKTPCNYHPGTFNHYPNGVKRPKKKGVTQEPLHDAWSCCRQGAKEEGCTQGKHEKV